MKTEVSSRRWRVCAKARKTFGQAMAYFSPRSTPVSTPRGRSFHRPSSDSRRRVPFSTSSHLTARLLTFWTYSAGSAARWKTSPRRSTIRGRPPGPPISRLSAMWSTPAIAGAAYRAEIEATEQIVAFQKEQLRITENQAKAGTVPYSNVLAIRAQLAATEATLPPLRKSLSQTQHLLTALVGQTPEQWAPPPLDLANITLPVELPVSSAFRTDTPPPGYSGCRGATAQRQRQHRGGDRGFVPQRHLERKLRADQYGHH